MMKTAYEIKVKMVNSDIQFKKMMAETKSPAKRSSISNGTSFQSLPSTPSKQNAEDDVEIVIDDDVDPLEKAKVDKPLRVEHLLDVEEIAEPTSISIKVYSPEPKPTKNTRVCDTCQESFPSAQKYNAHMRLHHTDPVPPKKSKPAKKQKIEIIHRCAYCRIVFDTEIELQKHNQDVHIDPHRCNDCDISYSTERALGVHNTLNHSKKFKCTICGVVSKGRSTFDNHMKNFHPEVVTGFKATKRRVKLEVLEMAEEDVVPVEEPAKLQQSTSEEAASQENLNFNDSAETLSADEIGYEMETEYLLESDIKIEEIEEQWLM